MQQDPHYRGDCTTRGYYQTPAPAFYLGYDMPRPQLPPFMVADETTDVFGIELGDAEISPRPDVKNIFVMPIKNQTLTLKAPFQTEATIWKGQQGTLVINSTQDNPISVGKVIVSEGIIHANESLVCRTIELRARGSLSGNLSIDSLSCEGALHYEGCRLLIEREMTIDKLRLPSGKNLYVEMRPGKDVLRLGDMNPGNIEGNIIFSINEDIPAGRYLLIDGEVKAEQCKVRGLTGRSFHFESISDPNLGSCALILVIDDKRGASQNVIWSGAESGVWDYQTKNFYLNGMATSFVEGDCVTFNDEAITTTITLNEIMPAQIATFENEKKAYTLLGNGGISGRTILRSGKLTVKELNYNFEIGKATLVVNNTNAAGENNIILTDSATVSVPSGTVALKGKVSGDGSLRKTGNGQLSITFAGANDWTETILEAGTLAMGTWNTTIGKSSSPIHVIGNSTFIVFNNNSTSQVPSVQNTIIIEKGKTLTFHAGKRCAIKGALKGEGTFKIDFPYVRGDVSTNTSLFEGIYEVTTENCRFVQAMDLSKATLKLDKGSVVVSMKSGSGSEQNLTHKVGTLTGSGTLGNGTWNVASFVYSDGAPTISGTMNLSSPLINVSPLCKSLCEGNELKIFEVKGKISISGEITIIPSVPNEGLVWDTSSLSTNGILRVILDHTGIDSIPQDSTDDATVYDLFGRKTTDTTSGLFIVNGKKTIRK